tara:strand:- start:50022 stop:50150 length:129 start_codon:yes stop_codon:yes gene_type:complete
VGLGWVGRGRGWHGARLKNMDFSGEREVEGGRVTPYFYISNM